MTDKLLKNRGGLYNRIRNRIYIRPFTLKETEEFFAANSTAIFQATNAIINDA